MIYTWTGRRATRHGLCLMIMHSEGVGWFLYGFVGKGKSNGLLSG